MAESQLMCMEDGHINEKVPDVKPEFYYSEEQRSALEELLKNGDGAFKTRLREDRVTDFLSAREIKTIRNTFRNYETDEHDEDASQAAGARKAHRQDSTSLRSTYWPQMSDTEVPPLDIGWPSGGFFKGVTRVSVHTHPPKDNGPHIKEVVRRLIQGAGKVIAIVMDLLTDVQILRDLLDAASKRGVPVYIVLDIQGMPHFLDMCNRLCVTSQHLVNIRVRTVRGVGFDMSFGRIPGSLCSKYMLIDGDKVAFGTYSYSWTTSRMDRNMITVLSGQIVDTFDRDFRELYAISDNLNLFKEFNVSRPRTETLTRVTVPKRPTLSTTARFQVSLGERGELKVPAHKYYNPKYLLALGEIDPAATSKNFIDKMEPEAAPVEMAEDRMLTQRGSEEPNELSPLPDQTLDKSRKNMRRFEIKPRILKKTKVKKTEGSNKQCRSPAPSTTATPALTSHMAEPTQGLERGESTPGGGEKPNEPNTSTDLMQNKSSKRFRLFKKKSATPINKMAASNEDTLEVDEQGSSAPCTIGNSVPTNVSAKLTQDFPPTIESTPAKTNAKGPGHQTMNSQEDQGAEDQVHKKKTCILS